MGKVMEERPHHGVDKCLIEDTPWSNLILSLNLKKGGIGLRQASHIHNVAYTASIVGALRSFRELGDDKILEIFSSLDNYHNDSNYENTNIPIDNNEINNIINNNDNHYNGNNNNEHINNDNNILEITQTTDTIELNYINDNININNNNQLMVDTTQTTDTNDIIQPINIYNNDNLIEQDNNNNVHINNNINENNNYNTIIGDNDYNINQPTTIYEQQIFFAHILNYVKDSKSIDEGGVQVKSRKSLVEYLEINQSIKLHQKN